MSPLELIAAGVLTALALALVWNDLRHFLLPNVLTALLLVAGLGFTALLDRGYFTDRLIGIVAGFASFEAVRLGYRRLRGRDGLGAGDVKLMAAAGAWVGWQGLPSVVLIGTLTALAVTLAAAKLKDGNLGATTRVPLGAFLATGLWVTWLVGPIAI